MKLTYTPAKTEVVMIQPAVINIELSLEGAKALAVLVGNINGNFIRNACDSSTSYELNAANLISTDFHGKLYYALDNAINVAVLAPTGEKTATTKTDV